MKNVYIDKSVMPTVQWYTGVDRAEQGKRGSMVSGMQLSDDFYTMLNSGFRTGYAYVDANGFTHDGPKYTINNAEDLTRVMRDPKTDVNAKKFIEDVIIYYFKDLGNPVQYKNYGSGRNWAIPEQHMQYFIPSNRSQLEKNRAGGKLKKIYL